MRIRKQELAALDLEQLANLSDQEFLARIRAMNLDSHSTWIMPQLVSIFGQWRLYSTGKATVLENCKTDFQKSCWRLSRVRRSTLVKNQTQQPDYAQFTPLVLLGFKRMQGFQYEQFRELSGLEWLLEPDLYEALVLEEIPNLSRNRLLEIRQQGLAYKTGPKQGTHRNPESTWQLYAIQDTELGGYPKLTQTMLTQCWLAHPKYRRQTMILDLNNWDNVPEPLIEVPLVKQPSTSSLPWLE